MNSDAQLDFLIKKMAQEHHAELPSPGVIWWRAQIQKKLAEKERIEQPMTIMRVVVVALCIVAAFSLAAAAWSGADSFVRQDSFWFLLALLPVAVTVFLLVSGLRAFRA